MCHAAFKKSYTSVVLCGIAAACRIHYRDHVLDGRGTTRESAGGRGRKPVVPRGRREGAGERDARLYGVSSNRRVSAACFNLTSLSASVPSGVARTLLVSSRTRQTPGFNIKPPPVLASVSALSVSPPPLLPLYGYCGVSLRRSGRWIFHSCELMTL